MAGSTPILEFAGKVLISHCVDVGTLANPSKKKKKTNREKVQCSQNLINSVGK